MKGSTAVCVSVCSVLALALAGCGAGERAGEGEAYELEIPRGLEAQTLHIPADNPITAEKVALGKQLFFDPRLSADGTVACATCHNPRFGYTDARPVSTGIRGQRGGRSAPPAFNRVFSAAQFWDGRAASLEEQAKGPIENPIEMGFTHDGVVQRLRGIPGYRDRFERVFGTADLTIDHIAMAIATYERTLVSGDSPYDRYRAGERGALSPAAERGLGVFLGKGGCAQCHTGANFTDERYHNLGLGAGSPGSDPGRQAVTGREEDLGAFKTPTLRDVALTAPYFHDGSARTLEEVVDYYDRGGTPNAHLSARIRPLGLTARERRDLVAFLHSLTGEIPLAALAPELPRE